jgi:3-phenylpropionate/trans-cinnamate dioxygenase ferredoxin subunit
MSDQETAAFVRACGVDELKDGGVIQVVLGGDEVAIVKTEGEVFAIRDWCSHAAVPLSEGEVDGCTIECWLHGSRFDLRTGEPTGLPATEPIPVFPVEIHEGDVYISLAPSNGVNP